MPSTPPGAESDEAREGVLARLSALPTTDLMEVDRVLALNRLSRLDPEQLAELAHERRS